MINSLLDILKNHFRAEDLKELYFRLFAESPDQESKTELIRILVEQAKNQQRLEELIERIQQARPKMDLTAAFCNFCNSARAC